MRILLVGEYSRLHNSLKEGLLALGHEVFLIATGDYFKNLPADLLLERRFDRGLSKKMKVGIYKLSKKDLTSLSVSRQFFSNSEKLKNFDVVQLINESPLGIQPSEEIKIIDFLKKHNKKVFLLSCETDFTSVSFAMDKKIRYSIFTPLLENRIEKSHYQSGLRYLEPEYQQLHKHLFSDIIEGVIASDMDYHIPLENHPKYLGLLPNPVNVSKIKFLPFKNSDKIVLFLGINRSNYFRKGIDFFEKALTEIQQKYPDKVEVIKAENLPYNEYIQSYAKAHILLDQVYSFQQGYNALEAMAAGKVVFTGAEKEFLSHFNLKEDEVCINALPDVDYLVKKLVHLIENPDEIERIGKNARDFIKAEHDYKKVAQRYLDVWQR